MCSFQTPDRSCGWQIRVRCTHKLSEIQVNAANFSDMLIIYLCTQDTHKILQRRPYNNVPRNSPYRGICHQLLHSDRQLFHLNYTRTLGNQDIQNNRTRKNRNSGVGILYGIRNDLIPLRNFPLNRKNHSHMLELFNIKFLISL